MITNNKIPRTQLESDKGVNVIYRDFITGAALTGTTSITLIKSALIPANTVAINDYIEITSRVTRNTATGTATNYLYYNTINDLSGATLLATQTATNARQISLQRNLIVRASNDTETFNTGASSSASDPTVNTINVTWSSLNIDWTNNVYIIAAFANASTSESTTSRGLIITRLRL